MSPRVGVQSEPVPFREIARMGLARLLENRPLVALGALGIVAGLFCVAVFAARGGVPIPPEGDLTKPASFDIAVGIYVLTVALLLPAAGFSEKGRQRWVWWNVGLFLYGYTI